MLFGKRETIQVSLVVHGPATRFLKAGDYELRSGEKVKALLKRAGLSGAVPGLSCLIEGERVDLSRKLTGGETVTVLQMIAGG
jgi:sulfur carrier protein ThiS